jgi:hypothetical protein
LERKAYALCVAIKDSGEKEVEEIKEMMEEK